VSTLFALAIERARADADHADRAEVAARIRGAVASSGLTNAEFARFVGTSASRLSTYLSGKVTPSSAMLVRIERVALGLTNSSDGAHSAVR
jgi:transcriptional regulator with XRE-family HTH domain